MPSSQTILSRWDITDEELTAAIDANPSLRGMLFGYIAEHHLRKMWFAGKPEVTAIRKDDDHNRKKKGDLVVTYKNWPFKVECKSLQTASMQTDGHIFWGKAQCDASDKRLVTFADGSTLQTTCLLPGEFDILAVNVFAFQDSWRFVFAKNIDLPRSTFRGYTAMQQAGLLASLIRIDWPPLLPFRDEPFSLMDELITNASAS